MKSMGYWVLMVWVVMSGLCLAAAIDQVVFGDGFSESAHGVSVVASPVEPGAMGQGSRRIGSGGAITFTLACDPARQNYLTVKLWGGDTVGGTQYLYLYNPVSRIGANQSDWPEVAIWTNQSPFPGRFVYSTYLIPLTLTAGKTEVTLKLADAQLAIYRVYSHLDSFWEPVDEVQGVKPGLAPLRPAGTRSQYGQLVYQANLGINEFLTWQKYGPAWDVDVAAGRAPAVITGAVTFDGRGGSASWTVQQWKEDIYGRFSNSNMVSLQALEAYGIAYTSPWSDHYRNPELVDRIVKGLDFFRIAQGANGAFGNPWGLKWVGGPNRINGAHCLEGFGIHALPDAFLLVHNDISVGVLNELVDEDDNPATPAVTRKASYINLFKGIISHMLSDRGHAPNQDRAQVHAMVRANQCLQILSPADVWPESAALQWVYEAIGFLPSLYGGYWESEKGLALEVHGTINGGYCGNYGTASISFIHPYGAMTGGTDAILNNHIHKSVNAFANFLYLDRDSDGYRGWVNESVISWRPNRYPAREFLSEGVFNGLAYAAIELNNPYAVRLLRDYIETQRVYTIDCSASAVAAHYEDKTLQAIKMVDRLQSVEALAAASAKLPMESGDSFAWADEQAASIVVSHKGARLYMTLNWRHDYCSGCSRTRANAIANNIARVHYTTDTIDRIANVAMQTPRGMFKLYTCRYGDYFVAMNLSDTESFAVDVSGLSGAYAADMIGGVRVSLATSPILPPRSTMVLYPGECLTYLPTDLNLDCTVDLNDFSIFASEWLSSSALP